MSLIKVSSSRGDYVLLNPEQVAWATVDADDKDDVARITLHMMDGIVFQLRGGEARYALEELQSKLGEPPENPDLPGR